LTRRFPATGGDAAVADEGAQAAAVQRAIRPEAVALSLFALVLAAGAAAIVVLLVARAAWPTWRLTSIGTRSDTTSPAPGRWPRLAAWLTRGNVPVTAAAGVRLALEPGRGRTAVPVRAALWYVPGRAIPGRCGPE
jgi:putative ABC transport system permease protein